MSYQRVVMALWLTASAGTVSATSHYTVTDLGPVYGYRGSVGYAVNTSGQVAGACTGDGSEAVFWQDGAAQDLGYGAAYGLNEAGQVVGWRRFDVSSGPHAFLWSNGQVRDLGTLDPRFNLFSYARDINDLGHVVGYASTQGGGGLRAVLWRDGEIQNLGTLPGGNHSVAYSISDSGLVVGEGSTAAGETHAVLWRNGLPEDMGAFNWDTSQAYGVNESGQVVGALRLNNGFSRAFIWQNGTINIFGGDNSLAYGINSRGDVVGASNSGGAFLWQDGVVRRLADLIGPDSGGWVFDCANAISDNGNITGYGVYNGQGRAFLMTPVPEPSTILALLWGLGGVVGRSRKLCLHRSPSN